MEFYSNSGKSSYRNIVIMSKLVVIACYNENVDWIGKLNCPFIIYNKGDELDDITSIPIPNIGREGETWLRYFIEYYYKLPNTSILLQGNPFYPYPGVIDRINTVNKTKQLIRLGNFHYSNGNGCPDHCGLPIKNTYYKIFNKHKQKQLYTFATGAQYIVPKALILNHPIQWWQRVYKIYNSHTDSAWIFERLWEELLK